MGKKKNSIRQGFVKNLLEKEKNPERGGYTVDGTKKKDRIKKCAFFRQGGPENEEKKNLKEKAPQEGEETSKPRKKTRERKGGGDLKNDGSSRKKKIRKLRDGT